MTYARTVAADQIPDQSEFHRSIRDGWWLGLTELLGLVATLNEAGYNTGDVVSKVEAIAAALDTDLAPDSRRRPPEDLIGRDPAEVVALVRQSGIEAATRLEILNARNDFDRQLARDGAAALHAQSDAIVEAMRSTFDPALAQVRAAADAGLTPHTDTTALLATGSTAAIKAYRNLLAAVPILDQVAGLRLEMANVADIGSRQVPIANLLATADSQLVLDGAQNAWQGEVETVQAMPAHLLHPITARMRKPRLGGRWLALVVGGYEIQLSTAGQVATLLHGVHEESA
jgi:hypothetical protein